MKKLGKMLTVVGSICLLTACGASNQSKNEVSSEAKSNVDKSLVEDGVLDIATSADLPPYEFYDDNKNIIGIDAEIAQEIGKKLNVEVKIHDMDFGNIIATIENKKMDLGVAGLSVTEERKKSVDFTDTYAKCVQKVLVKNDSPIKDIEGLKDKKIAAQLGTTGDMLAKEDFGEDNVQSFAKFPDAVLALQNGKVDAIILDDQTASKFAQANKDLKVLESTYADEEYAMAVNKDNKELLEKVNQTIKELKDSGKLDQIVDKYIEK